MQTVQTGRLMFTFLSFNFTQSFFYGSEQIWRTKVLQKCQGAFVCVYDQNPTIVIVTQPKRQKYLIHLDRKTNISFLIQVFRPFFSVLKQIRITKVLDKCQDNFICVYDRNHSIVIKNETKKRNVQSIQTGKLSSNFSHSTLQNHFYLCLPSLEN